MKDFVSFKTKMCLFSIFVLHKDLCKKMSIFIKSFAFFCENYALNREKYAFYRESFTFIRES